MPDCLDVFRVNVTARTTWIFFRVSGPEGETGLGEATINRSTDQVLGAIPAAVNSCNQCELGTGAKLDSVRASLPGTVGQAIASALEQAWLDWFAKTTQQPLHVLLGGCYRHKIPTYANINRGTITREPKEFAARAQAAVDAGYKAVKLAPFDHITADSYGDTRSLRTADSTSEHERKNLIRKALARIAAVSDQISGTAGVRVDCHSRLRTAEVFEMIDQMAELGVEWFEEPVLESVDTLEQIAGFRRYAKSKGILLAGAEKSSGLSDIADFLSAGSYDILMPDIILAGGPSEAMRMGHLARLKDCAISLHNPCGPVMDVMSAQVAAALPSFHSLERQVDESPLYDEIVERKHQIEGGNYLLSNSPGAGCSLVCAHPDVVQVARHRITI